jgi:hypothetical protein
MVWVYNLRRLRTRCVGLNIQASDRAAEGNQVKFKVVGGLVYLPRPLTQGQGCDSRGCTDPHVPVQNNR